MEIKKDNEVFWIGEEKENPLAEITFQETRDGVLEVFSTRVDPSLRGQGVAGKLLQALVNHAREEGYKIDGQGCSYVAHKFEVDPVYEDVKAEEEEF